MERTETHRKNKGENLYRFSPYAGESRTSSPSFQNLRATGRTRTADPRITNALLYQLSHSGIRVRQQDIIAFLLRKAGAKVRYFCEIRKYIGVFFAIWNYFCTFAQQNCILYT